VEIALPGETDLARLLREMDPELDPEEYVFALGPVPPDLIPLCRFHEDEGESVISRRKEAERLGLRWTYPCRRITLRIHSSLEAIGLLARITVEFARAGISVNVVSACHHDHLFVPVERAEEAMGILAWLRV
jgi:hypothetical protein